MIFPNRKDAPRDERGSLIPPAELMTEDEFAEWCWDDEFTRAEYKDGEVILLPPQTIRHSLIVGQLLSFMFGYVRQNQLGKVLGLRYWVRLRPGLRRAPDLLFGNVDRLHMFTCTMFEGPPNLIVEVVSPESRTRDLVDKVADYAQNGVNEYWTVDVQAQEVVVRRLMPTGVYETMQPIDGRFISEAIPGFWVRAEWLFADRSISPELVLSELGAGRDQSPPTRAR